MDTVGKYLVTRFDVPFVAAVRYGLNLVLLLAVVTPGHGAKLWHTNRTALVVLRAASLAGGTFFAGMALQRMPVGETVAILYLQGFGVMLVAGWLLKEKVSVFGWACAIFGFTGVVLIARPGGALAFDGVLFALAAAAVSVVYVLLSRSLAPTETTMAMLFHVALVGFVAFGLLVASDWKGYAFSSTDIYGLLFMGVASLVAHFMFTQAYRHAPASMLAPFTYFHIAVAVLLSWMVYAHVPDILSFIGMAMIALSGIALALYIHLSRAKELPDVEA